MKIGDDMTKSEEFLWSHYYKENERNIKVPDMSLYTYMLSTTKNYSSKIALNYFGKKITFKEFKNYIDKCAKSLKVLGVNKGDIVTICMPNTPEAVISFFAVNKIGAIANMIHPLSAEEEIKQYLNNTKSKYMIALNQCYSKIKKIIKDTFVKRVVIASPSDSMPIIMNTLYNATMGRKEEKPVNNKMYLFWQEFIKLGYSYEKDTLVNMHSQDTAVILHSGGTTGVPKSIVLANSSIIGVNEQAKIFFPEAEVGDSLLLILPLFHCFGLVVGMFIPLCRGASTILIPQFDAKKFDKLLSKYHPTFLLGVPTLFEAMLNNKKINNMDLSYLKTLICGGDSLSKKKNAEINEFLAAHHSSAKIIQGYGMTETCGPVCYGTHGSNKLGSIGIPLPGNIIRICDEENREVKPGELGEICIHSIVVMQEYLNNLEETKKILTTHSDNRQYIHTGDLGYMDEDGVIYYVQRKKRIIISSGYNIYPQYIENVLKDHPYVKDACVVGIPHPYKKEIAKAFIILKDNVEETYTVKKEIMDYAEKNLAHYMIPREYIYRKEFPKTKMAKTDYLKLQEELINKKD